MGFWYYCQEKCCGARLYAWDPSTQPEQYGGTGHHPSYASGLGLRRTFAPLHGRPNSIDKQSDGWVLLKDGYGIRDDGSLWRWSQNGRAEFFDPGPWKWVSSTGTASVGIKQDGTLWSWDSPLPGNGDIPSWSATPITPEYTLYSTSVTTPGGLLGGTYNYIAGGRARLDCKIERVEVSEQFLYSPTGLEVTLSNFDRSNTGTDASFVPTIPSAGVYFVDITNGGGGYSKPPRVVFDPPGASATAIIDDDGVVTFVRVDPGGSYVIPPIVSFVADDGDLGSGCTGLAYIEGSVSVAVTDGGSGYTSVYYYYEHSKTYSPPVGQYAIRAKCDPPAVSGRLHEVTLSSGGQAYFSPVPPSVSFSGLGEGAEAEATVDEGGLVTSISITEGGSGYKEPFPPSVLIEGKGVNAFAVSDVSPLGKVAGVRVINPGSGYDAETKISFPVAEDAFGEGAEATPVIESGKISRIVVTKGGTDYFKASPPSVIFSPPGATAVAKVGGPDFEVTSITVTSPGVYLEPTAPIAVISSNNGGGSGGEIGCSVNDKGVVDAVWIKRPGKDYASSPDGLATDYDETTGILSHKIDISFTPKLGAQGSGGSAIAKTISAGRYSRHACIGGAVLFPGKIESISYPNSYTTLVNTGVVPKAVFDSLGAITDGSGTNLGMPHWRALGSDGELLPSYRMISYDKMIGIKITDSGSGYTEPPTVTLSGDWESWSDFKATASLDSKGGVSGISFSYPAVNQGMAYQTPFWDGVYSTKNYRSGVVFSASNDLGIAWYPTKSDATSEPTLRAYIPVAGGSAYGSGAEFTVSMSSRGLSKGGTKDISPFKEYETWEVESVDVVSGGSGYRDMAPVLFDFSVDEDFPWAAFLKPQGSIETATAVARTRRDEPVLEVVTDNHHAGGSVTGGYGGRFTPTLKSDTDADGRDFWTVASVTVDEGGWNYKVGDRLSFQITDGENRPAPFNQLVVANVSKIGDDGEAQEVEVKSGGGGFFKDSGVIESVKIISGGVYFGLPTPNGPQYDGSLPEVTISGNAKAEAYWQGDDYSYEYDVDGKAAAVSLETQSLIRATPNAFGSRFYYKLSHEGATGVPLHPFETITTKRKSDITSIDVPLASYPSDPANDYTWIPYNSNSYCWQPIVSDPFGSQSRNFDTAAYNAGVESRHEFMTGDKSYKHNGLQEGSVSQTHQIILNGPVSLPPGCKAGDLEVTLTKTAYGGEADDIVISVQPEIEVIKSDALDIVIQTYPGEVSSKIKYYEDTVVNSLEASYTGLYAYPPSGLCKGTMEDWNRIPAPRFYLQSPNHSVTAKLSLTPDWYVSEVSQQFAVGEFRPQCNAIHTEAFAIPDTESYGKVARPAVIKANLIGVNGITLAGSFAVEDGGGGAVGGDGKERCGYTFEPTIKYEASKYSYTGGGTWSREYDRPTQIGEESDWESVECVSNLYPDYGINLIVATRGGNVWWWGRQDAIAGGLTLPAQKSGYPHVATQPLRLGSSLSVESSKAPDDLLDPHILSSSSKIRFSYPEDGVTPIPFSPYSKNSISLSSDYTGPIIFSDKKGYGVIRAFNLPAIRTGYSFGYISSPSVSYMSLDGSNPIHFEGKLYGPDGSAKAIIRAAPGGLLGMFAVLCDDGSLWSLGGGNALSHQKSKTYIQTCDITEEGKSWGVFETKSASVNNTYTEIQNTKTANYYIVSTKAGGSGYVTKAAVTLSGDVIDVTSPPPQPTTVERGRVEFVGFDNGGRMKSGAAYCEGGPCDYNGDDPGPLILNKTTACTGVLATKNSSAEFPSVGTIGGAISHANVPAGPFVSSPSVSLQCDTGSGATFLVEAVEDRDRFACGWRKIGGSWEEWTSAYPPLIAVAKSGDVRRFSPQDTTRISYPVSPECADFISVASGYSGSITGAAKEDGSIWAANASTAYIENEIELTVTRAGSNLTLPPAMKMKQPDEVPIVEAHINGKVVAFGVMDKGSGYSKAPEVKVDGNAKGVAHICGGILDPEVTAGGSKYRVPPKVSFSRPGMPAAVSLSMTGSVDGITLSDGGSGYSSPPSVTIVGDGKGATAEATILGFVDEIIVTKGGSGYKTSPKVVVSPEGCTAVAVLERGQVQRVVITYPGSGYSEPPAVSFDGGEPSSPAAAVAVLNAGVASVAITAPGEEYTEPPRVRFYPESAQATCSVSLSVDSAVAANRGRYFDAPPTAAVTTDWCVSGISLSAGGSGYQYSPSVLVVGGSGRGAEASCQIHGPLEKIVVVSGGYGYTDAFPPYVSIEGGLDPVVGVQAKATAVMDGGSLKVITIDDPGSGYITPPTITLRRPEPASAKSKIQGGLLSQITVINSGAFYASPPDVLVTGGSPTKAAKATAEIQNGSVSSVTITDPGVGYLSPPDVYFIYDSYGEGASAAAVINGTVNKISLTNHGSGYVLPPEVLFVGGGGDGAKASAVVSQEGSGAELTCKIDGRVEYIELTDHGSGYEYPPAVSVAPPDMDGGSAAVAQARILGRIASVDVKSAGSGHPAGTVAASVEETGYTRASETLSFPSLSSGAIHSKPQSLPSRSYVQNPAVVVDGELTARPITSLSRVAFGVDHLGLAYESFSYRPTNVGVSADIQIRREISPRSGAFYSPARASKVVNASQTRSKVSEVVISDGGDGYVAPPTVSIGGWVGSASISGGKVTSVSLGAAADKWFTSPPAISFSGGGDYGSSPSRAATALSVLSQQVEMRLQGFRIVDGGDGYTSPPSVTVSPGSVVATANVQDGRVYSVGWTGTHYFSEPPQVTFSGGGSPSRQAKAVAVIGDQVGVFADEWTDEQSFRMLPRWRGSIKESTHKMSDLIWLSAEPSPEVTIENELGTGAKVEIPGLDDTSARPLLTISGGQNYLTRYESGDPYITIRGAVSLAYSNKSEATATVTDGQVTSIEVTNGGTWVYRSVPAVYISGGGGEGAKATAIVENKKIASIRVDEPGAGYSSTPTVTIIDEHPYYERIDVLSLADRRDNPPIYNPEPYPSLHSGAVLDFVDFPAGQATRTPTDVEEIYPYVISSGVGLWVFAPIHPFYDQGSVVSARLFHRDITSRTAKALRKQHASPPAVTVSASADPVSRDRSISSIDITDGGEGYESAPAVAAGGGCIAEAVVAGGQVVRVNILNPGSGYITQPEITFSGGNPVRPATAKAILAPAIPEIPEAKTHIVKWHPQVVDGLAIRDVDSEEQEE